MKTAVVTGASRGIGKEIAIKLADAGYNIAILYIGEPSTVADAVNQIAALGVKVRAYPCDVANFNAVASTAASVIADFGGVDVLVNNAGITRDNLALRMSEDEFDSVININLKGTFNCSKHFMRAIMKSPNGRIINIASVSGIAGTAGQANYASSKAGVIALTKVLARELASKNVTVNAIAPGYIATDMTAVLSDDVKADVLSKIPLRRVGTTLDIANTAAFLASDAAAYITGQTITVDGGMTM